MNLAGFCNPSHHLCPSDLDLVGRTFDPVTHDSRNWATVTHDSRNWATIAVTVKNIYLLHGWDRGLK